MSVQKKHETHTDIPMYIISTTSVVQLKIRAVTRHYTLQYVELYIHT